MGQLRLVLPSLFFGLMPLANVCNGSNVILLQNPRFWNRWESAWGAIFQRLELLFRL